MNRAEYIERLTACLGDVPQTEREEAIQYYSDYFDDAGAENEAGVIASLGTPEELAKEIKAGASLVDTGQCETVRQIISSRRCTGMKKFTKRCLMTALVIFIIGCVFCIFGFVLGGFSTEPWKTGWQMTDLVNNDNDEMLPTIAEEQLDLTAETTARCLAVKSGTE
jgi:uncharacterized membrane protein